MHQLNAKVKLLLSEGVESLPSSRLAFLPHKSLCSMFCDKADTNTVQVTGTSLRDEVSLSYGLDDPSSQQTHM